MMNKMTKQEQIEEMAVIGCVRNPQAHTAEECSKCDFKQGCCNAYRHSEALYNAGYRKVDEFEDCKKCPAWSGLDCTRNPYTDECLDTSVNVKNAIKRLEKTVRQAMISIRNETAKEILDMLYDMGIDKEILECCRICDVNGVSLAKQICEKYDVEVEQ